MDAGKLFAQLMNRGESASGGILTGTAVSDSVDGSVMVQMDGSVVAQPSEDETELVVSAEEFADGSYVLPSVPYAGTLTVADANDAQLEEDEYSLDGSTLTIHALSSAPVDVSYETNIQQVLTNSDFDGDTYSLPSITNLTVREDGQPVQYTLDGNLLTIEGIEHVTGVVEFSYTYDVSVVCSAGVNVLPNAPDEVAVFGRNASGVDVVVTDYVLSGSTITLPETYDAYTVDYPVSMVERWNVSDQYEEIPLEDSDDAADPETVTIGHNLQWEPSSVTSCTVDGVSTTYTLDVANVVVDAPTITERYITLTYDLPVRMQVPASSFAVGPFTLPSVPVGSVITTMGGTVLANTVDDTQLTIDSLMTDSPTYTLTYTEQVEQDVVELPCTPYVAEGQFVEVAVVNGMPTVIGASGSGDVTMTLAGDAADAAAAAEEAAAAAQEVAEAMNQHFWTDSNGVHVTEITQEEWATAPSGANQLSNSEGILLRDGLNPIVSIATGASSGMSVFDGTGSASTNVLATFTDDGVTLGKEGEIQAFFTPTQLYLANGGFKPVSFGLLNDPVTGLALLTEELTAGIVTPSSGEPYVGVVLEFNVDSVAAVYVNGSSVTDYELDGWNSLSIPSASEGDAVTVRYYTGTNCVFAQFGSVAQARYADTFAANSGRATGRGAFAANWGISSGRYSFAAGNHGAASGSSAVAIGENLEATGANSVAIGGYTHANGYGSHAQNIGSIANGGFQTALGKWNVADTTSAVILGNGTGDTARSNALTVDWSGNVTTAGNVSADTITTTGNATIGGNVSAAGATLSDSATVTRDTTGDTGFIATRSDTNVSVGTIVGTGGTNHGLYSFSDSRWIIYSNGTDIRTGAPLAEASGGTGTTYGLQWQHLGSFTGTNNLPYSLTDYSEVMYSAKANGKLVTATVAKQLLTSSAQELWLGGGKSTNNVANAGNLRAVINVSLTGCRGVNFAEGSTDRTSSTTWNVYAR